MKAALATPAEIEPLELRIAPATIFAVTDSNGLFSFDSADPANVSAIVPITGLEAGETIKAMDFRPATGALYAVAISGAGPFTGQLYTIDLQSAAATAVGVPFSAMLSSVNGYGMDFNPVTDLIRITNSADENIRLNPTSGTIAATDTAITGAASAAALAYTNSYPGATATTLYAIDFANDDLHILGGPNANPSANGGAGTKLADINVLSQFIDRTSLDILTTLEGNRAFYAISNSGSHRLYDLNLATGAATPIGAIGNGATPVFDIAVQPAVVTFADGRSFTYTDGDGDLVTVKTSAGTLKSSQFGWLASADGTRRELTVMNIAGDASFTGANLTFTAKKTGLGGNGRVDLGFVNAAGINLGIVKIAGSIEEFDAGTNDTVIPAIKSFSALSMGRATGANDSAVPASEINGNVPLFKIKTDILGAAVQLTKAGVVSIGGSLIGSNGAGSGSLIIAQGVQSFLLRGSVTAGDGANTGVLAIGSGSGAVKIGGSLLGGSPLESGTIQVSAKSFALGGSIVGGNGPGSGSAQIANATTVSIGGSIIGNAGMETGSLAVFSNSSSVRIGGSVVGGEGFVSGRLIVSNTQTLKINGSIIGGASAISGVVDTGPLGTFLLGGDVQAGQSTGSFSGALFIETAKSATIKGSVIGQQEHPASVVIKGTAFPANQAASVAVGTLTIGGSVSRGQILLGLTQNLVNTAAGKITIGGDFLASSIVAGFREGIDGFFGTDDDLQAVADPLPEIKAAIATIIIKGRANGTPSDGDHYGIVAEQLGTIIVGGHKLPLTAGQDNLLVGIHGDLRVREGAIL